MYPVARLISSSIRARLSRPLATTETGEIHFYVRPWDIDFFLEVNNGRIFTLLDLGRFALAIQSGLARELRKNRWGLVVAGSTIQYRGRIRMFDKVTMRTRLIAVDERWMYLAQSMSVGSIPKCSALLRTAVTSNGRAIPTDTVIETMNIHEPPIMPDWVKAWIEGNTAHPWPPKY